MIKIGPSPNEIRGLGDSDEVTFAPMEALADGLGGLNVSLTKPLGEVARGSYNYFAEGDVLLAKVTPCFENGKKAIAHGLTNGVGFATSEVHIIRPDMRKIDTRFLRYLFCSEDFRADCMKSMTGAGGLRRVSENALLNYRLIITDRSTQKSIADFLDRETAHIDQLIGKKGRLTELLGEKLEDDILRAVTLGIDPDVELVPEDELEWTTHRPKHWKPFRLKYFFRENTQYSKDGQETLFSLRMKEGLVPHNEVSDKEITPIDLIDYKKVSAGQIVMNRMRAAIGLFGLADRAGIVSPDYSIFDVSRKAHAAYFLRLFRSVPMMTAFRLLSKGLGTGHSGFMRLNADNFGRIRVAVPELEEQRSISKYVEDRIGQLAKLQVKNELSIDRLKEYRAALITAAVAGQTDVATWGKQGRTDRRLEQIEERVTEREGLLNGTYPSARR